MTRHFPRASLADGSIPTCTRRQVCSRGAHLPNGRVLSAFVVETESRFAREATLPSQAAILLLSL